MSSTSTLPVLLESPGLHGLGLHVVPTPKNVPLCWVHKAWVVITQNAGCVGVAPMQHAPRSGLGGPHGEGTQVVPTPWNVPPWLVQFNSEVTMQLIVPPKQHAPVCGGVPQVVVVHMVPTPWNTPLTAA